MLSEARRETRRRKDGRLTEITSPETGTRIRAGQVRIGSGRLAGWTNRPFVPAPQSPAMTDLGAIGRRGMSDFDEIIKRRFGSRFEQPCNDPNVLECAMFECQKAGVCQKGNLQGIGTQLIRIGKIVGGGK